MKASKNLMSNKKISDLYLQVSNEYNKSPLALSGWIHEPTRYEFIEIEKCLNLLPNSGTLLDIGTGKGIAPLCAKN